MPVCILNDLRNQDRTAVAVIDPFLARRGEERIDNLLAGVLITGRGLLACLLQISRLCRRRINRAVRLGFIRDEGHCLRDLAVVHVGNDDACRRRGRIDCLSAADIHQHMVNLTVIGVEQQIARLRVRRIDRSPAVCLRRRRMRKRDAEVCVNAHCKSRAVCPVIKRLAAPDIRLSEVVQRVVDNLLTGRSTDRRNVLRILDVADRLQTVAICLVVKCADLRGRGLHFRLARLRHNVLSLSSCS